MTKHYDAVFEVIIEAENAEEAEDLANRIEEQIRSAWQGGGIQPVSRVADALWTSIGGDDDDDDDDDAAEDDNRGNR